MKFWDQYDNFFLYNQPKKRNDFMGHRPPPPPWNKTPLTPNTYINIVPEMRIWSILLIKSDSKWCIHLSRSLFLYSKHYVGVGSFSRGETILHRQKSENVAIWSMLFYINDRVLLRILRNFFARNPINPIIPFILFDYNLRMQRIVHFEKF